MADPDIRGLFDSHAHYYDKRFDEEYPGGASKVLSCLEREGIGGIVNVGTNPETSRLCLQMACGYSFMYAAAGIHPEDCHGIKETPERAVASIRELIEPNRKKIVALGEIGLDYYRDSYFDVPLDKEQEKDHFDRQLTLSEQLDLPVIVHDREAHGDCMDMILSHPKSYGVFHSFSGSWEMASELIKRGWYISFSGVITFKNATRIGAVACRVPSNRILAETDCPYLAPHPFRGTINHSGLMAYTVGKLAELRGVSYETMVRTTADNAKALFRL